MNDKMIGLVMIFGSLGVIGFIFVWTILLPIIEGEVTLKAYLALAIVVFIAILAFMLLTTWIGWNFLRTRAPKEDVLEEKNEESEINQE
ncbi:MAG: hypothetical protein KAS63_03435 [Candidatus Heimdallarchaeota archaeon]|nr:hypothetical protein [Candidatus Heimdallarchaeota archaeon]MCK4954390.1 hypothetical protein [Candidatus Heimdallarchaeota archaeon]